MYFEELIKEITMVDFDLSIILLQLVKRLHEMGCDEIMHETDFTELKNFVIETLLDYDVLDIKE